MTLTRKWAFAALGALAFAASASSANAADVYQGESIKDEPDYSTPYIGWTGFYVGGNIGGIFDVTDGVEDDDGRFAGGFHLGYNWQLSDRFVVGLEGDMSFIDADAVDYLSSIRGRLGWSRGPMLAYLTGGVAFLEFDDDFDADIDPGYVVGGGIEYKLRDNWSIGAEGLYYGFDDDDFIVDEAELWTARARLSYHIGGRY